ncbi:MAG: AAA family ATPase [Candidatus Saccharibacteria bacterium]|nr:MAG: AAA family ATPase [Candidatus Saccharibacteria bacterium]
MNKPIIIYISGSPGAGKTTLAKLISEQLYIPHVSSDLVHGGIELTQSNHDRKAAIANAFVPLMISMAQKQISFVVDHVLQKDMGKADIIDKLVPHARIIYIHVYCADPIARYIHRIESSDLPNIEKRRAALLERAVFHKENLSRTADVLDLSVPTLVVATESGYNPAINDILAFIQMHNN